MIELEKLPVVVTREYSQLKGKTVLCCVVFLFIAMF